MNIGDPEYKDDDIPPIIAFIVFRFFFKLSAKIRLCFDFLRSQLLLQQQSASVHLGKFLFNFSIWFLVRSKSKTEAACYENIKCHSAYP
jgi:hypothetical protein